MNALFIKSDTGENNESDVRNVNGQTTSGENNENVDDSDSQLNTGIDFMSLNDYIVRCIKVFCIYIFFLKII